MPEKSEGFDEEPNVWHNASIRQPNASVLGPVKGRLYDHIRVIHRCKGPLYNGSSIRDQYSSLPLYYRSSGTGCNDLLYNGNDLVINH